jgi:hypothetical protein
VCVKAKIFLVNAKTCIKCMKKGHDEKCTPWKETPMYSVGNL